MHCRSLKLQFSVRVCKFPTEFLHTAGHFRQKRLCVPKVLVLANKFSEMKGLVPTVASLGDNFPTVQTFRADIFFCPLLATTPLHVAVNIFLCCVSRALRPTLTKITPSSRVAFYFPSGVGTSEARLGLYLKEFNMIL